MTYRGFDHDFGTYYEVICLYDPTVPKATAYAFDCESRGPMTWEEGGVAPPQPEQKRGWGRGR